MTSKIQRIQLVPCAAGIAVTLSACPFPSKFDSDTASDLSDSTSTVDTSGAHDSRDTAIPTDSHTGLTTDTDETGDADSDDSETEPTESGSVDSAWGLEDADAKIVGAEEGDGVGLVISAAGDNNGDGLNDVVVQTYESSGTVVVVHSPIEGTYRIDEAAGHIEVQRDDIEGVGISTTSSPLVGGGDMAGDGYADILIGTPYADDDYTGWVWLVQGPVLDELDLNCADAGVQGVFGEGRAGGGLAWGKDMNNDGFEDFLVGVNGANEDGVESELGYCGGEEDIEADFDLEPGGAVGAIYVVLGPVSGEATLSDVAAARWYGEDGGDGAGGNVAEAGDLDGDGRPDMLLAAKGQCERGLNSGAIYVVLGPVTGDGALSDADGRRTGEYWDDRAGESLSVAGDTNADGYTDILIGSPENDHLSGKIWLELGPVTGSQPLTLSDASFTGEAMGDSAGYALSSAGDQDADGYDDFLIGAPTAETPASANGGIAYLIFGPVSGAQSLTEAETRLYDSALDNSAGKSLANLGDTNADGQTDLLIGAYRDGEGAYAGGAAYLLLGGGELLTHALAE